MCRGVTGKHIQQHHHEGLTCIEVSDNVNTGSYGHSSVHKRGAGGDAQVLVVKIDPSASEHTGKTKDVKRITARSRKLTQLGEPTGLGTVPVQLNPGNC